MGIGDQTGSLKPGKRADLIMVDTRASISACSAIRRICWSTAAEPANVDTVVVDGRILKRHGKLTALDVDGHRRRGCRAPTPHCASAPIGGEF